MIRSMASGEHSHAGLDNLEAHLTDCSDIGAHGTYSEDYMHKHFAECLEDDPNAVMHEKLVNVRPFKIWMIIIFWVICLAGLIPKAWPACARNETALSLLNCFSAGLFLAMCLVHIMPEGVHLFDIYAS